MRPWSISTLAKDVFLWAVADHLKISRCLEKIPGESRGLPRPCTESKPGALSNKIAHHERSTGSKL
jgi:hypothetical protein